jgi:hypothetical protein
VCVLGGGEREETSSWLFAVYDHDLISSSSMIMPAYVILSSVSQLLVLN